MKKLNIIVILFICCFVSNNSFAQEEGRDGRTGTTTCFSSSTPPEVVIRDGVITTTKYTPTTVPAPFPPPPPPNEDLDRIIFMVHGLGGGEAAWSKASYAIQGGAPGFPARKAVAVRPSYGDYSLPGAGIDLHNNLVQYDVHMEEGMDPLNNFIIGHSQGGLAARFADQYEQTVESQRRFNGIVTFATAHQGARILNNMDMLFDIAEDGTTSMLAGPVMEKIETSWILDIFLNGEQVVDFIAHAANVIVENLLPIMMTQSSTPITQDYVVGASPIAEINNANSNVHKIAFYGVENEPVLWRLVSSQLSQIPNEADYFSSQGDGDAIQVANSNRNRYYGKYMQWRNIVDDWNIWNVLNITTTLNEARDIRDAYQRGYKWWVDANDRYKLAIGAIDFEYDTSGEICECKDFLDGTWSSQVITTYSTPCSMVHENEHDYCTNIPATVYTQVNKDSDGVVLVESAANFPGASTSYKLSGSNHLQMRNDPNTKDALLKLLNGEFDPYFKTDPK